MGHQLGAMRRNSYFLSSESIQRMGITQEVFALLIKMFIVKLMNTKIKFIVGFIFLLAAGYYIRSAGQVIDPILTLQPVLVRDGKKGCVQMGDWFNFHEYTISLDVWPDESQVEWAAIIDNNHRGDRSFAFHQKQDKTNTYSFGIHSKNGAIGIDVTIQPKKWTHVVLQNTGKSIKMYVDGRFHRSLDYSPDQNTQYTGEEQLCIGGWFPGGRLWRGKIKDLEIYNKAISTLGILQLK